MTTRLRRVGPELDMSCSADDEVDETAGDDDERVAEVCLGIQQAMRVPGAWQPRGQADPAATPRLVSFRVSPKERWLGTWLDDPR